MNVGESEEGQGEREEVEVMRLLDIRDEVFLSLYEEQHYNRSYIRCTWGQNGAGFA